MLLFCCVCVSMRGCVGWLVWFSLFGCLAYCFFFGVVFGLIDGFGTTGCCAFTIWLCLSNFLILRFGWGGFMFAVGCGCVLVFVGGSCWGYGR